MLVPSSSITFGRSSPASHSLLRRTSKRPGVSKSSSARSRGCPNPSCTRYVSACASTSAALSCTLVALLPVGSPMRAVKSPRINTAVWPASWNARSRRNRIEWPRWMSLPVGSMPSFTRSGRPVRCASASRAARWASPSAGSPLGNRSARPRLTQAGNGAAPAASPAASPSARSCPTAPSSRRPGSYGRGWPRPKQRQGSAGGLQLALHPIQRQLHLLEHCFGGQAELP